MSTDTEEPKEPKTVNLKGFGHDFPDGRKVSVHWNVEDPEDTSYWIRLINPKNPEPKTDVRISKEAFEAILTCRGYVDRARRVDEVLTYVWKARVHFDGKTVTMEGEDALPDHQGPADPEVPPTGGEGQTQGSSAEGLPKEGT